MNMKRKVKTAILLTLLLLGTTLILSGCIDTVETVGWEHGSFKNGAVLKGVAPEKYEGYPLIKLYFVYDNEPHEKISEYEYQIKHEDINKKSIAKTIYFEGEINGLIPYEPYYFRAVAQYAVLDGSKEMTISGDEISFSLMQNNKEESIIK